MPRDAAGGGGAVDAPSEGQRRVWSTRNTCSTWKNFQKVKLFQHLVQLIVLFPDYGLQNHPEPLWLFDIFVSAQEMLLKRLGFLTFRLCCNYGQGCSRRRSRKGCPLQEAKALTISSSAPRRGHPLPLRLLLHSGPKSKSRRTRWF